MVSFRRNDFDVQKVRWIAREAKRKTSEEHRARIRHEYVDKTTLFNILPLPFLAILSLPLCRYNYC